MTLIVDCNRHITKPLRRSVAVRLPTDGLIFTGIQVDDDGGEDGMFIGDLQMFLIADRPDEAFFICTKYSPSCPGTLTMSGNVHATGSSLESAELTSTARTVGRNRSNKIRNSSRISSSSRSKLSSKKSKVNSGELIKEDELLEGRWGGSRGGSSSILLDMANVEGQVNAGLQDDTISIQGVESATKNGVLHSDSNSYSSNLSGDNSSQTSAAARATDSQITIENASADVKRNVDSADALYDYLDYGSENEFENTDDQNGSAVNNTFHRGIEV